MRQGGACVAGGIAGGIAWAKVPGGTTMPGAIAGTCGAPSGGASGGGMGCMPSAGASCDGYTGVAAGTLVPSYNKKSGIWSGT